MKTVALLIFIVTSVVPFVDEPQKLQTPQPATIQLKRR